MMENEKDTGDKHPGLAQLTQAQIEYLIATVHEFKPELDQLFKRASSIDLFTIITYLSAVYFTVSPGSQELYEQLVNLFMNLYPFYLEADVKENKADARDGFRVVIPTMPPRKPEDEVLRAVILEQSPTSGLIN